MISKSKWLCWNDFRGRRKDYLLSGEDWDLRRKIDFQCLKGVPKWSEASHKYNLLVFPNALWMFLNLAGWVSLWFNLLLVLFSLTSDRLFEVMQLDTVHMVSLAQDGRMVASVELKEGYLDCKTNVPKAIICSCLSMPSGPWRPHVLVIRGFLVLPLQYFGVAGDVISLRPGEECPADGVVTRGSASCSEAVSWQDLLHRELRSYKSKIRQKLKREAIHKFRRFRCFIIDCQAICLSFETHTLQGYLFVPRPSLAKRVQLRSGRSIRFPRDVLFSMDMLKLHWQKIMPTPRSRRLKPRPGLFFFKNATNLSQVTYQVPTFWPGGGSPNAKNK